MSGETLTRGIARVLVLTALAAGATSITRAERAMSAPPGPDLLADEIARWSAFLRSDSGSGAIWEQVKDAATPLLTQADEARRSGRRLLAWQRLAAARESLAAADDLFSRPPAARTDGALFEAEWRRTGEELRAERVPQPGGALDGVSPAALRAIAEAALAQVRVYYEASLEYGRNTMPEAGLYYLGAARAQREWATLARRAAAPAPGEAPPLRPLGPELDALEAEILALYRPPASIDRHTDFIRASSALKDARELDAAALRHGALLRYLQAAQRLAPLRTPAAASPGSGCDEREALRLAGQRLSAPGVDHSIGRLFLETAEALCEAGDDADPAAARAIVDDVLPRYFAAIAPASAPTARFAPRVTVTLVRWPYT